MYFFCLACKLEVAQAGLGKSRQLLKNSLMQKLFRRPSLGIKFVWHLEAKRAQDFCKRTIINKVKKKEIEMIIVVYTTDMITNFKKLYILQKHFYAQK